MNIKIYDCRNREIKDLIVYTGSAEESLLTGNIQKDIQEFKKGRRPKSGKYFMPEEFFNRYGLDKAHKSNIKYKGVQFIVDDKELIWYYYYPIDKLLNFRTMNTDICSKGICEQLLRNQDYEIVYTWKTKMINESDVLYDLWFNKNRNSFFIMGIENDERKIIMANHFYLSNNKFSFDITNAETIRGTIVSIFWKDRYEMFKKSDVDRILGYITSVTFIKSKDIKQIKAILCKKAI